MMHKKMRDEGWQMAIVGIDTTVHYSQKIHNSLFVYSDNKACLKHFKI